MKSIYVYGASGHGIVVADIAVLCGYEVIFIDDGENEHPSFEDIKNNTDIPIALGIGSNRIRANIFQKVSECGFEIVTLIHPKAVISESAVIGEGTVVMANVVVNAKALIAKGVILNTSSVIEHENIVDEFVHISPTVALAGNVKVGAFSHIGIGSCVIQNIKIGKNSVVGAGSVVVNSIDSFSLAYGNPCKKIRELDE